GRGLLGALLRRETGGGRAAGQPGRERVVDRRPRGRAPGRTGGLDQLPGDRRPDRGHDRARGVQHQRRREARPVQRPGRRDRGGPADRLLHHVGGAGGCDDRRPAAARRRHARAVRRRAGQGQPAHAVRLGCDRGTAGRRHARRDRTAVARLRGDRAGAAVTLSPLAQERLAYRRSRARRSTLLALASTVVFAAAVFIGVTSAPGWPRVQETFFDLRVGWESLPEVAAGLWLNLRVLVVAEIGVLALGLLIAVLRTLRGPVFFPLRALATGYVDLFRGVPLLIALYLIGFGLPALRLQGVPTDTAVLGTITLILVYSAYVAEVFRAGIESVHPSQRAAARSLGLTHRQTMRLVILPQAVRRVLPPLLNDFVALQKDVGLISVLG